jgi:histidine ammonia-lyase
VIDLLRPDPPSIDNVVLTGSDLTLPELVAVARHRARVSLHPRAEERITQSRTSVELLVESGNKVYGLNTGFGSLRDVVIPPNEVRLLQQNLIRSHAAGVGDPLPEDVVRAMMVLRLNALAAGFSGIRLCTLERIVTILNADVYPWVPSRGSVGASGDLAPLAHLALVITGDPAGKVYQSDDDSPSMHRGEFVDMPRHDRFVALADKPLDTLCGLDSYELEAKEGLALTNGTQLMTALGALSVYDALVALEAVVLAAAASVEAIKGSIQAFDARISDLRNLPEQAVVAGWLSTLLQESTILRSAFNVPYIGRVQRKIEAILEEQIPDRIRKPLEKVVTECREAVDKAFHGENPRQETRSTFRLLAEAIISLHAEGFDRLRADLASTLAEIESVAPTSPRVQDDYSFRCAPQVLGSALWVLHTCLKRLESEMNAVTDNPLIFPPQSGSKLSSPEVLSGGNFHGEPVAMAMDMAAIAVSEIAALSERQSAQLLDSSHHYGLPSQLVARSGVNSGFMIAQYTAAALASECKLLAHPASVDSIPTCENTEDHVSMGPISGLKLRQMVSFLEDVVGIELLLAGQALDMWQPLQPGVGGRLLLRLLDEAEVPFVEHDLPLYDLMERTTALVRQGTLHAALRGLESSTTTQRR